MQGRHKSVTAMVFFTILATLLASFLATGMSGCGEDDNDTDAATGTVTASTSTTGSRATDDVPHSVTVTAFTSPYETDEITNPPDEGMVLARVDLKIVNESDDTDYEANANMFVIEDDTGEDYVHFIFYNGDDAMGSSTDSDVVAPRDELEVALLFEVPPGVTLVGVREGLGYPDPGDLYPLP